MEEQNNDFEIKTADTTQSEIICNSCSAKLVFKPGTTHLTCEFCGSENAIEIKQEDIVEFDFEKFISENYDKVEKQEIVTIKCDACAAQTTLDKNVVSDNCPFCGNVLVVKNSKTSSIIKPGSLLPFKIDSKKAFAEYQKWLNSLWWAPSDLKKYATQQEKLKGMYIPYWTFDSNTQSSYSGQRGDDYQTTETYRDSAGKTQTRTVTRTRWSYVSGNVSNNFNDVLVLASKSLPKNYTEKLEPWDLENLIPHDEKFLSGFRTETYQVDLKPGFDDAKLKMDEIIKDTIRRRIGGDHQRISSVNSSYNDIKFKHILLPVWISAYRYNSKVYRFLVNARTSEVQGERPYSWLKISLAILLGLGIIGAIIYFAQ